MAQKKTWNGVTISIMTGDITDLETESIVFYARDDLKLDSGFGSAIASRGGIEIGKQCKEIGKLEATQTAMTGAGAMKTKFIIHANGPKFQEPEFTSKLKKTIINALTLAEQRGISRLSFPAMGAGYYGLPAGESADLMLETFQTYTSSGTSLKQIDIVLLDKRQYAPFEQAFQKFTDNQG